jgi:hypothetical protein
LIYYNVEQTTADLISLNLVTFDDEGGRFPFVNEWRGPALAAGNRLAPKGKMSQITH